MENKPKTTAKDFFLCLAALITSYTSVIAFLVLIFHALDIALPLAGEYAEGAAGAIRSSIATLVIFFPALLWIVRIGIQELRAYPEKKDLWVYKWFIYLSLFLSGLTIGIDLVTLIYQFLGAEDLALRFILKVIFVLLAAFAMFYSSISNLRRKDFNNIKDAYIRITLVSLFVLGAIVWGIILIGTPSEQRAKMFDDQRVSDLASIQNQIVYTEWENLGTVPTSTDALNDPISGFIVPTDPQTGATYGYQMLSKNSFELCATFETVEGTSTTDANAPTPAMYPDPTDQNWAHGVGNVCFTRVIDPSLYKVVPPVKN